MIKKLISVSLVLIFLFLSLANVLALSDGLKGDVNGDGVVDNVDYILVKRHYLGSAPLVGTALTNGDIDGDGDVDKIDCIMLKRIILGTSDSSLAVTPRKVVSYGKSYTKSVSESSNYPDSNSSELTDGVISGSAAYENAAYCGFKSSVNVDMDLGSADGKNLRAFELSYLSYNEAGITPPKSFTVYGSNNGSSWTQLGYKSLPKYASDEVMSAVIELNKTVDYRYIRFTIGKGNGAWLFFDELLVYADQTEADFEKTESAYKLNTVTDSDLQSQIARVSDGVAYNPLYGETIISKWKAYTVNCSGYDSRCGANSTRITDATETGLSTENPVWVGIDATKEASITINLGSKNTDLTKFSLHCFNRESGNIYLPEYVDVSVSSDNSKYYNIGRAYPINSNQENFEFTVSLKTRISAQYVRFSFKSSKGYVWVEEAEVYANRYNAVENVYDIFDMPLSEIASYYSSYEEDYNRNQNLLLGKQPEILSDVSIQKNGDYATKNSPESSSLLTDGEKSENASDNKWFTFYKGSGRKVFFDLEKIVSLYSFSVSMLYNKSSNIELPSQIIVSLSENGKDWYRASTVAPTATSNGSSVVVSGNFKDYYRARYVMLSFPVNNSVYIDEIAVNGIKNYKLGQSLSDSPFEKIESVFNYGYSSPSANVLGGAEDVCLMYHNQGDYDYDTVYPYVAYVDKNGNTVDTMFDSFLLLPSTAKLPSGGTPYGTNTASDWYFLADDIFDYERNLSAIEKAVGDMKNLLDMPDYTVQIFVTIPHMDTTMTDFGDIDGDGDSENLTVLSERVYVAKYYVDYIMKRFARMGYKNIKLGGFYWFHEEIAGNDVETAKQVNAALNELGTPLFWIPWFKAPGYDNWSTLGFDATCLQPNYAFSLEKLETRLREAAKLAKQYGMSIEMETSLAALTDIRFFKKYMGYLSGGMKYGYINECIHMYYQSFNVIPAQHNSSSDRLRLIYEYTYKFIKGALDITPNAVEDIAFNVSENTPKAFTLNPTKDETVIFDISKTPEHGSVALEENGKLVYYPNKDFKGTDTFTYKISNYLGWSEDCVVTVTVE